MTMPAGSQRTACLPVALALVGVSPKGQLPMICPEKAWRRARGSLGLTLDLQLVLHQMPHCGEVDHVTHMGQVAGDKASFFWSGSSTDQELGVLSPDPLGLLSDVRCKASTLHRCIVPWLSQCGSRQFGSGCHHAGGGGVGEGLDGGLFPPTPTPVQSGWGLGARAAAALPSAE